MAKWGYTKENGPATWCKCYPAADGQRQSPINITTKTAKFDNSLSSTPLSIFYSQEDNLEIENCGFSFKVNIKKESNIKGGPLDDTYRLEQFHLHWGSCDSQGSEHTIDGKTYAAELHLVHWNATKYKSFADAVNKEDGLAVFGIMLEVGEEEYEGFKQIVDAIDNVKQKDQKFNIPGSFSVSKLLPNNTNSYWTYLGSLTTPPCYESVTWIVFAEPLYMSKAQINKLRSLLDSENGGECIVDNFRPPLPLGARELKASFAATD